MKKLKAAIVGCGRISVSYADAFHRLSDEVELAYAVDKDPALAKAFAEEFNCSWTTDFDEILEMSDRIIVMFEGQVMGEYSGKNPPIEEISLAMAGK